MTDVRAFVRKWSLNPECEVILNAIQDTHRVLIIRDFLPRDPKQELNALFRKFVTPQLSQSLLAFCDRYGLDRGSRRTLEALSCERQARVILNFDPEKVHSSKNPNELLRNFVSNMRTDIKDRGKLTLEDLQRTGRAPEPSPLHSAKSSRGDLLPPPKPTCSVPPRSSGPTARETEEVARWCKRYGLPRDAERELLAAPADIRNSVLQDFAPRRETRDVLSLFWGFFHQRQSCRTTTEKGTTSGAASTTTNSRYQEDQSSSHGGSGYNYTASDEPKGTIVSSRDLVSSAAGGASSLFQSKGTASSGSDRSEVPRHVSDFVREQGFSKDITKILMAIRSSSVRELALRQYCPPRFSSAEHPAVELFLSFLRSRLRNSKDGLENDAVAMIDRLTAETREAKGKGTGRRPEASGPIVNPPPAKRQRTEDGTASSRTTNRRKPKYLPADGNFSIVKFVAYWGLGDDETLALADLKKKDPENLQQVMESFQPSQDVLEAGGENLAKSFLDFVDAVCEGRFEEEEDEDDEQRTPEEEKNYQKFFETWHLTNAADYVMQQIPGKLQRDLISTFFGAPSRLPPHNEVGNLDLGDADIMTRNFILFARELLRDHSYDVGAMQMIDGYHLDESVLRSKGNGSGKTPQKSNGRTVDRSGSFDLNLEIPKFCEEKRVSIEVTQWLHEVPTSTQKAILQNFNPKDRHKANFDSLFLAFARGLVRKTSGESGEIVVPTDSSFEHLRERVSAKERAGEGNPLSSVRCQDIDSFIMANCIQDSKGERMLKERASPNLVLFILQDYVWNTERQPDVEFETYLGDLLLAPSPAEIRFYLSAWGIDDREVIRQFKSEATGKQQREMMDSFCPRDTVSDVNSMFGRFVSSRLRGKGRYDDSGYGKRGKGGKR
ncbi:unnamed protein product [Amoebophrya sp. A25]|nr:unnamed protein product [Amoebophrya sp. A25]|eukprot:GSA25T00000621001.1